MAKLTHVDASGRARMVDVGIKEITARRAVARGEITMNASAYEALRENRLAKGDAVAVARIAAIQAAKRTADWIPLCHSIPLDAVEVQFEFCDDRRRVVVEAEASARWRTGVEMEALVAVQSALLAIYDMAKALDRRMEIGRVHLVLKEGGRSGSWHRDTEAGS